MPLITKHYNEIYGRNGTTIRPDFYELEAKVEGFSNSFGKPSQQSLQYVITRADGGPKRFTRKGVLG